MTTAEYPCGNCNLTLGADPIPCPRCGSIRRNAKYFLEGVSAVAQVGVLGIVADSPTRDDRLHRIEVRTPLGASSKVQLNQDGSLELQVSGSPDVGTRGEPQVRDVLVAKLTADGHRVTLESGAENDRGEDGLIVIDGARLVVQITAIPPSAPF